MTVVTYCDAERQYAPTGWTPLDSKRIQKLDTTRCDSFNENGDSRLNFSWSEYSAAVPLFSKQSCRKGNGPARHS